MEFFHAIHRYAKANNKYKKDYDPSKEFSYLIYWNVNNLHGCAMSQKLPVDGSKWEKNLFRFDKEFIQNYDEDSDKGQILALNVDYPNELQKEHNNLPFLPKIMNIDNWKTRV